MTTPQEKAAVRKLFTLREFNGVMTHHFAAHGMAPILALARDNPIVRSHLGERSQHSKWIGFDPSETLLSSTAAGVCETALRHFDAALARINACQTIGGRSIPAMAGGAWIIPKAITGLPMAAMAKPRARLPLKAYRFSLRCNGMVNPRDIAKRCAMIARAAWEYTLQGGIAQVTIAYIYNYSKKAPDGARAAVFEVTLPLNNKADLAYSCSAQAYRGISMMIAKYILSPVDEDRIPSDGALQSLPGRIKLNGSRDDIPLIEKALTS